MSLTSMKGQQGKKAVQPQVQKELQYQQWKKATDELRKAQLKRKHSYLAVSIVAKAKNGKSGLALDIRTPKEVEDGQIVRF